MITFVPVGGLANRMRSIDAAVHLAQEVQTSLHIIWYQDWGLQARFDQLFKPLDIPGVTVTMKEASLSDLVLRDRPRRRNFYIPRLFHSFLYQSRIYEVQATELYNNSFDFTGWARNRNVWLASCINFYPLDDSDTAFGIFKSLDSLQQQINYVAESFNDAVIGIHIRRTDHADSIAQSPTALFIDRMKEEVNLNPETMFYLATDSEQDKTELKEIFGDKIITSPRQADRGSLQGMQDALIEMYLLSRSTRIIGSFRSSYSETAAQISGIGYEALTK